MADSMDEIMHPGSASAKDPEFPHAPADWSRSQAEQLAAAEGLVMTEEHWQVVAALQAYYDRLESGTAVNVRELHDALDERFYAKGGIKFLYEILPGGPVAQGCRLAGLEPPADASNPSFGSVQ